MVSDILLYLDLGLVHCLLGGWWGGSDSIALSWSRDSSLFIRVMWGEWFLILLYLGLGTVYCLLGGVGVVSDTGALTWPRDSSLFVG